MTYYYQRQKNVQEICMIIIIITIITCINMHFVNSSNTRICIVLGNNNNCYVDVANPLNLTNFTLAAAKTCKLASIDNLRKNPIELEIIKVLKEKVYLLMLTWRRNLKNNHHAKCLI